MLEDKVKEKYIVIHSSDFDSYISLTSSHLWITNLKDALAKYHSEQPFNYDKDEVRLLQLKETLEDDNSITTEVMLLKYKGGYSDEELLQNKVR